MQRYWSHVNYCTHDEPWVRISSTYSCQLKAYNIAKSRYAMHVLLLNNPPPMAENSRQTFASRGYIVAFLAKRFEQPQANRLKQT